MCSPFELWHDFRRGNHFVPPGRERDPSRTRKVTRSFLISEGTTNVHAFLRVDCSSVSSLFFKFQTAISRFLTTHIPFWPYCEEIKKYSRLPKTCNPISHAFNASLDGDFKDRKLVNNTAPTSLQSFLLENPWHGHKPVPARWIYHGCGLVMTIETAAKLRL